MRARKETANDPTTR